MDTYHASQVVFTLVTWVAGILLIVAARKNQKRHGNKAKTVIFYALGILIVLSMIGQLLSYAGAGPTPVKTSHDTAAVKPPTRHELLVLVNNERARAGVSPLKESRLLDKSAQWKSDDETEYHYYAHVKPGTKGNNGLDYLNSLNPPCSYIEENLDVNYTSVDAVNAWMGSKVHRAAILSPKYTLTGFGISKSTKYPGQYNLTEHFCQTP